MSGGSTAASRRLLGICHRCPSGPRQAPNISRSEGHRPRVNKIPSTIFPICALIFETPHMNGWHATTSEMTRSHQPLQATHRMKLHAHNFTNCLSLCPRRHCAATHLRALPSAAPHPPPPPLFSPTDNGVGATRSSVTHFCRRSSIISVLFTSIPTLHFNHFAVPNYIRFPFTSIHYLLFTRAFASLLPPHQSHSTFPALITFLLFQFMSIACPTTSHGSIDPR